MKHGDKFPTNNCGTLEVIKYHNSRKVSVKFIDTGYVTTSSLHNIEIGSVRDRMLPVWFGVGLIGEGPHKSRVSGKDTREYKAWIHMLERCYCKDRQKIQPTYIGVTVCEEWHNFQNFAEWFDANYIKGYQIDKDILQKGVESKIYSPSTCLFVSQSDNIVEAHAKHWRFISPQRVVVDIYNLRAFCRSNNLQTSGMLKVNSGKQVNHKGWTRCL